MRPCSDHGNALLNINGEHEAEVMKRRGPIMLIQTLILVAAPIAATAKPSPTKTQALGIESGKERIKVEIPKQTTTYRERTSTDKQETARALFRQANELFEKRRVDEAVKLYRKAYRLWPHPRILFNIAVSLGFLARPLESAETFKKVLAYGPDPITPERYKQAIERYTELVGQLAQIVIECNQAGAKIFVDGRPVGTGPMHKPVTTGPGMHLVSANKPGRVPFTRQVSLNPGHRARVKVVLQPFDVLVQWRTVKRYHWMVPATVTATAVALAGAGLGLLLKGRADIDDINADIKRQQTDSGSKSIPFTYDTNKENRSVTMQVTGQALLGAAGAAAIASIVLWLVRNKRVKIKPSEMGTKGPKLEVRF